MNEIEKRFDAAMDLVKWLDHRITQQVERQLEQWLAQEREYWRCTVSDLIAEERERVNALLRDTHKDIFDLTRARNEELFSQLDQIRRQSDDRLFDRLEAVLGLMRRPDDDGEVPPSKH